MSMAKQQAIDEAEEEKAKEKEEQLSVPDDSPLKGMNSATINLAKKAYADFLKNEALEA